MTDLHDLNTRNDKKEKMMKYQENRIPVWGKVFQKFVMCPIDEWERDYNDSGFEAYEQGRNFISFMARIAHGRFFEGMRDEMASHPARKVVNDNETKELRGDAELIRKFGSKLPGLDALCNGCGVRYGAHTYDYGVNAYTDCPVVVKQEEKVWQERLKKFWVCWVEGTYVDHFHKHYTLLEAENEAERLAKLPNVNGKTVYVFECVGKCSVEPPVVAWVVTR